MRQYYADTNKLFIAEYKKGKYEVFDKKFSLNDINPVVNTPYFSEFKHDNSEKTINFVFPKKEGFYTTSKLEKLGKKDIVLIKNLGQLIKRPKQMFLTIKAIREKTRALLWIKPLQPSWIPLLAGLGVNIFDYSAAYKAQGRGKLQTIILDILINKKTLEENIKAYKKVFALTLDAIKEQRLQELIEVMANTDLQLKALTKILYDEYEYLEKVAGYGAKNKYISDASFNRVEVKRWEKQIMSNYKPQKKQILLLLPCSSRKPYFFSKSHKKIHNALYGVNWSQIQEIIITSPLGIVPRELEWLHPAAHYNITITGKWNHEEKERTRKMLEHVIKLGKYEYVFAYLDEGYRESVQEIKGIEFFDDLSELKNKIINIMNKKRIMEDYGVVSRFLFGEKGERILEGTKLKNRGYFAGNVQLASKTPQGLLRLTKEGAKKLIKINKKIIKIKKGKINELDPSIRPNEDVIVMFDDEVLGICRALVGAEEMKKFDREEEQWSSIFQLRKKMGE